MSAYRRYLRSLLSADRFDRPDLAVSRARAHETLARRALYPPAPVDRQGATKAPPGKKAA